MSATEHVILELAFLPRLMLRTETVCCCREYRSKFLMEGFHFGRSFERLLLVSCI